MHIVLLTSRQRQISTQQHSDGMQPCTKALQTANPCHITLWLCTHGYNAMLHECQPARQKTGALPVQQLHCACQQAAALLASPALCLVAAAEEDIHLPVAHPPVGHWHNVLLQAGAYWADMLTRASLRPTASKPQDLWPPLNVTAAGICQPQATPA